MLHNRKFSAALIIVVAFSAFVLGSQIGGDLFAAAADTMKPLLVSIVGTPDINVVNNASNPVPVTNVGSPNVNVVNNASNPVSVNDVNNRARHPVQFGLTFEFFFNVSVSQLAFNVPSGRELVIEYVSARILLDQEGFLLLDFHTIASGSGQFHYLPLSLQATTDVGNEYYEVAQEMQVYADPGTSVTVDASRSLDVALATVSITFSGYLVDIP